MKVEKINASKARIILTIDELKNHKITLKDIKAGKEKAQNFFFDILEDANLLEELDLEYSQLLIEAISQDNLFMITVTKADNIPDLNEYVPKYSYTVSSSLYKFASIEDLYAFCKMAKVEKLYIGTNSLYMLDNMYYLCFSNKTIKKSEFVKTFSVLSEYTLKYYSNTLFNISFKEHAKLLIDKTAIQTLQKG